MALILRLNCLVMMLGAWRQNFSVEHGLVFDSLDHRTGTCNYS
eukprot:SAG22_NODE_14181_length_382_cov_0.918728_1_plen_42_part_01